MRGVKGLMNSERFTDVAGVAGVASANEFICNEAGEWSGMLSDVGLAANDGSSFRVCSSSVLYQYLDKVLEK